MLTLGLAMMRWLLIFLFFATGARAQSIALPGSNVDFESIAVGSYTAANGVSGWTVTSATVANCNAPSWVGGSAEFSVLATPYYGDPYFSVLAQSPLGGSKIVKLNSNSSNNSATKLAQTLTVPIAQVQYIFYYA